MKHLLPEWAVIEDSTYESHKACLALIPEDTPIYALVEYATDVVACGDNDDNMPIVARMCIRKNPEGSAAAYSWFFLHRAGDISSHEDEELMGQDVYVLAWRPIQQNPA